MAPNKKLLWVISFHHACNDGTLMALVALLPILVREMGLTYYEVGLLGFGLLITVVVQFVVGRYADRIFSRYLLELGAALMGASFLLMLLINDFVGLFTVVIAMRIGASFYHPVGTSWITREFAGEHVETALGVQSGVGNLGVIIALGSSGFLGEAFSWRAPCILWAVLNLSAVLLGLFMVEESEIRTRVSRQSAPITPSQTFRKMWILVLPVIAGGALYQITSYFGPISLTVRSGWTAGGADLAFALWIGVGTVTSYYFGAMSTRYGKVSLLTAGYTISALGVLSLTVFSQWYLVGPALATYGAFLMMTYPALFSIITDITHESERGTAFGILFGFQLGGGAACVYLSGIIADALQDARYAFMIAAVLAVLSLATVMKWHGESSSVGIARY
ncbi:MAG: MFS transporter [Thermoplasmata archaeon]